VHAPGHGTVVTSGLGAGSIGNLVEVDHGDGDISQLMHLNTRFARADMEVCRYVTLGYAGRSGGVNPHIHFGTRTMPRFPNIYGARPSEYDKDFFDDVWDVAHHSSGGSCKDETNAYTVDDSQNTSRCSSCTIDEFITVGGWTRAASGGYAYFDRNQGSYYHTTLQRGEQATRSAVFRPDLQVADNAWKVYVLIPVHRMDGSSHVSDVAQAVQYRVRARRSNGSSTTLLTTVNQRDRGGEWVKLGQSFETDWIPSNPPSGMSGFPLTVEVTNDRVGECSGNSCRNKIVMADAAVFIPADCGP